MKFISHIRSISSKTIPHSPSPTSGVQTTITPVVTQIPEILWEIFSYLSQPDLIYGVSGVNRLWRSISADLVRGEIHWGDTFTLRNQNMCLARLGFIQVKTLHCLSQDKRTYPAFHQGVEQDVEDAWKRLMQTISFLTERGEHIGQDGMTTTRKLLPWRKIVYSGWNWFNERWDPLIQQYYLSMYGVRALHLKRITPGTVDLSCIFSKLLNLEELVIQSLETPPLTYKRNCTITWKERQDLVKEGQDKDNQQAQMQVLKLRTFKIHHLIVNQDALETILGAMPTLHTLELKFMICNNPHSGVSINRLTFIKFLAQHCPDLIHFHFSISGSRITIEEIQQIHVAFPKVTSLSLPACDIIPGSLDFLVDRLTRLEIDCSEYTHAPGLGDKLHVYLCQAPLLLHLKAYRTRLHQEHFNLQLSDSGRIQQRSTDHRNPQDTLHQPIWACRDLKTLYILIESSNHMAHSQEASVSRRIYGYISRVCPNLEDFAVERAYLHTDIDSGLLLLSRCKKLRHVRIYTYIESFMEERDLDWISLGMIDHHGNSNNNNKKNIIQQWQRRKGLLSGIIRSLFGYPGIGGMSKSDREVWTQRTIQALKQRMLQEEERSADALARLEEMDGNETEGLFDPVEMTTLDSLKHLVQQLQVLLEQSTNSSRMENKVCCWPSLETFEIRHKDRWAIPTHACQDLIYKLRPDLKSSSSFFSGTHFESN